MGPGPILLLGAQGQLGATLRDYLSPWGAPLAWGRAEADLAEPGRLREKLEALPFVPAAIVNAAAYTKVDRAESERDICFKTNAESPAVLARHARDRGILFVSYSTDYVYGGGGAAPWSEGDGEAPLNVYGESKLAGDRAVLAIGGKILLLRTSWVYSPLGNNFARTVLKLAEEKDSLSMDRTQVGVPTPTSLLAGVTALVLGRFLGAPRETRGEGPGPWGLYHLAPKGETTWWEFSRFLVGAARAGGLPLRLRPEDIVARDSEDLSRPARRPLNSRLNTRKIEETFGLRLPHWTVGAGKFIEDRLRFAGVAGPRGPF
ncbi:MAG: dTDP-4-dehydrorhamnose reductase [Deltaproteobacteria bacterium]|jgi:dTDP-4-dehydrorhamnose reductase|nr:dTDP-4-dehydrorhamnose reductase [Deltaproteobacteria bacterium]